MGEKSISRLLFDYAAYFLIFLMYKKGFFLLNHKIGMLLFSVQYWLKRKITLFSTDMASRIKSKEDFSWEQNAFHIVIAVGHDYNHTLSKRKSIECYHMSSVP